MNGLRDLHLRLRALFQKNKLDARMNDEMRSHIEMQTRENIEAGMKPDEARYAALKEFGWIESIKERCRDERRYNWIDVVFRDFRFGGRALRKSLGFTVVSVLTLALGIGVNLGLFGILNELMLRPKPVANPDELWEIIPANKAGQREFTNTPRPYYEAIRREGGRVFKGVVGYANIMPKMRTKEGAERVLAELVSGDYFSFLGIKPALGRAFLPDEDATLGASSVVMISYSFWQSQFGGATNVIGKTITLNDKSIEIVGVTPRSFTGLDLAQTSIFLPASMELMLDEHTNYQLAARLANPLMAQGASEVISPIIAAVTKELSGFTDPKWGRYGYDPGFQAVKLEAMGRGILGQSFMKSQIMAFVKFGGLATVLLLVIAAANVASLFLARALQRRKEMATRIALGVTRTGLIRQLLCEGLLISLLGTLGALIAFSWIGSLISKFASWWPGPVLDPVPDGRVLLFAGAAAILVGVGFSIAPALPATNFEPFAALKDAEGGESAGRRRSRLRNGLIVAQIIGCLVLLCGAILCLRSMKSQLAVDVGFQTERLATAALNLEGLGFRTNTVAPELAEIVRRVSLIPGVEQVGLTWDEPLNGSESGQGISDRIEGYASPNNDSGMVNFATVGPATFAALGVPILSGREATLSDIELSRKVAVVNESFVEKFWPGQVPLGKHAWDDTVIGVVKDTCFGRFDAPPKPMIFRIMGKQALLNSKLLVRSRKDSSSILPQLRAELKRIHPKIVKGEISTMRRTMENVLAMQRSALRILTVVGLTALALAMVGTYGVMAYVVTCRRREMGVRLAIGATRRNVMALVLKNGLQLGAIALLIGLPLAFGGAAWMRHLLPGVSPFDPVSFAAATACVLLALFIACWLPARRASRVDPMLALRAE